MSISQDPPPAANKWVDLADAANRKGVVSILLLVFFVWFMLRQQDRSDAQLAAANKATTAAIERCIAKSEVQAVAVKEAVKEVKAEVTATKAAVQQSQPTPTPTPTP